MVNNAQLYVVWQGIKRWKSWNPQASCALICTLLYVSKPPHHSFSNTLQDSTLSNPYLIWFLFAHMNRAMQKCASGTDWQYLHLAGYCATEYEQGWWQAVAAKKEGYLSSSQISIYSVELLLSLLPWLRRQLIYSMNKYKHWKSHSTTDPWECPASWRITSGSSI